MAILACAAIVDLPSYPAAAVLQSLERHGPVAWMALGSALANIALSVALVGPYGVEGVALGTLIAGGVEVRGADPDSSGPILNVDGLALFGGIAIGSKRGQET